MLILLAMALSVVVFLAYLSLSRPRLLLAVSIWLLCYSVFQLLWQPIIVFLFSAMFPIHEFLRWLTYSPYSNRQIALIYAPPVIAALLCEWVIMRLLRRKVETTRDTNRKET